MTLPIDLVLVRHGQSEANVVQKNEKAIAERQPGVEPVPQARKIFDRHDSQQRLTEAGRRQASAARAWLLSEGIDPADFDARFVSPFNRTMETAAILGPESSWMPDSRLIERDWGEYGATPMPDRTTEYPGTERMREANAFFARFAGGESMFDTSLRVRLFLGMCSREWPDRRVMAVCHGELMWATRFVVERLLPHEWIELDDRRDQRIANCTVLHYTRRDPEDPGEVVENMSSGWRRIVDPVDGMSPDGGKWCRLPGTRVLTATEMMEVVDRAEPLL